MNRQKREDVLRNSTRSGKPSDQPGRSNPPDRERMRGSEDKELLERQSRSGNPANQRQSPAATKPAQ